MGSQKTNGIKQEASKTNQNQSEKVLKTPERPSKKNSTTDDTALNAE